MVLKITSQTDLQTSDDIKEMNAEMHQSSRSSAKHANSSHRAPQQNTQTAVIALLFSACRQQCVLHMRVYAYYMYQTIRTPSIIDVLSPTTTTLPSYSLKSLQFLIAGKQLYVACLLHAARTEKKSESET
ncbi:unnamed protein product [Onchocerca flexuosa]|nr:unnamed protein product [Onchocerca flexuosa]